MRAVLQRVSSASVTVNGEVVGRIGKGICVLVGITYLTSCAKVDDQEKDIDYMVKKLLNIRVFEDDAGKFWSKSVKDLSLEVLCVSQFTLYGNSYKGNKPDFHLAMKSDQSRDMYSTFLEKMKSSYDATRIQDGVFGAMMKVDIVNEGPVTLILDSRKTHGDAPNASPNSGEKSSVPTKSPETQNQKE
ncbi:D-tyrosyl-tRNA(Tyr) deacylase [Rhizophlyctis rosea]|nr:D-tyrosyl-tRNA(Tyr) deacylase [Rhizophlyctis rosea]